MHWIAEYRWRQFTWFAMSAADILPDVVKFGMKGLVVGIKVLVSEWRILVLVSSRMYWRMPWSQSWNQRSFPRSCSPMDWWTPQSRSWNHGSRSRNGLGLGIKDLGLCLVLRRIDERLSLGLGINCLGLGLVLVSESRILALVLFSDDWRTPQSWSWESRVSVSGLRVFVLESTVSVSEWSWSWNQGS